MAKSPKNSAVNVDLTNNEISVVNDIEISEIETSKSEIFEEVNLNRMQEEIESEEELSQYSPVEAPDFPISEDDYENHFKEVVEKGKTLETQIELAQKKIADFLTDLNEQNFEVIAENYGTNLNQIKLILNFFEIKVVFIKAIPEDEKQVIELAKQDYRPEKICNELEMSYNKIRKIMKKHKIWKPEFND